MPSNSESPIIEMPLSRIPRSMVFSFSTGRVIMPAATGLPTATTLP